jgi:hypothetical protein
MYQAQGTEQRVPALKHRGSWYESTRVQLQIIINPATDILPDAKHQDPATKHQGSYYRPHHIPTFEYQGSRVNPTKHQGSYYRIICPASKYPLGKECQVPAAEDIEPCLRALGILASRFLPQSIRRQGSFSGTTGSRGCSIGFRLQGIPGFLLIEH